MNKGFEVIEARWLFDLPVEQINVVIHPQSIIHSMVEYIDGSIIAQMSRPDMRLPILYALSWPERYESVIGSLDLLAMGRLTLKSRTQIGFPALIWPMKRHELEEPCLLF